MYERNSEKSALNWNLSTALSSWQKKADSQELMKKMQHQINDAIKSGNLNVMIKDEVLRNVNREESFISRTVAEAYGKIEGNLITFSSDQGISIRVGGDKKKGYLFLEKDGNRIGYCRPDYIAALQI